MKPVVRWLGLILLLTGIGGCSRTAPSRIPVTAEDAPEVVCLGYADVEGGVTELRPEQLGRVLQVLVQEGQSIKVNQDLIRLDDAEALQQVALARANLKASEGRANLARQDAKQHPLKLKQLRATVEATTFRLSGSRISLKRQEDLFERNLVSKGEVDVAREMVRELEASVDAARAKLAEAEAIDPKVAIDVATAEVEAAEARLKQMTDLLDRRTLRAPSAGVVLTLSARPGEIVGQPGMPPPLVFQPDRAMVVHAEVEQELVSRVVVGNLAMVRDEMAGKGPWRGSIARIGGRFSRRRHRTDPTQFVDVPTVECLVRLESPYPPLRIGQKLRVSIYARPTTTPEGTAGE